MFRMRTLPTSSLIFFSKVIRNVFHVNMVVKKKDQSESEVDVRRSLPGGGVGGESPLLETVA